MLCKIVSGKSNNSNVKEFLFVYEWIITQDTFASGNLQYILGSLTLTRAIQLESRPLTTIPLSRIQHLSALKETGIVVIDREDECHKAFLYDFNTGYTEKAIPQAIYGCGTYAGSRVTAVSKEGIVRIEIKRDEGGNPADLNITSEQITAVEDNVQVKEKAVEITEDLEKTLCKYSQSKEFVRKEIIHLIKSKGAKSFRKQVEDFVNKVIDQYRQDNVPIMRKEEIDKDIDKGLIIYQLKYIQHLMVVCAELFVRCGFASSDLSLQVYLKVIECCERAVFAIELRVLQNDMLTRTRSTQFGDDPSGAVEFTKIFTKGMEEVLARRGITREVLEREGLTAADAFYASLGNTEDLFEALILVQEELALKARASHCRAIEAANCICIRSLEAVKTFRLTMRYLYEPQRYFGHRVWTSSLEIVRLLSGRNVPIACERYRDVNCPNRNVLKKQVFKLAAIVFYEMQRQSSLLDSHNEYCSEFDRIKTDVLTAISFLHREEALELAIEYKSYAKTVELCELTGNRDKLHELLEKWKDPQFLKVAFKWYVDSYKESPVAKRCLLFDVFEEKYYSELENFLQLHYPKLLWLFYIKKKRNGVANLMILNHAEAEPKFSVLQVSVCRTNRNYCE
eukprot:TRINITY_DN15399_c0_g3_i2.p1 TRINITY_DN15399_c0_g3~~TRINITY_DN15399_c0_g3_i2.p1  ORF type:complete len:624 (-),score=142.35 TRINITY_DN15399_c0_g3_i2:632-2503(-)